MNNEELQQKIEEIINQENFFDMMEAVCDFEKEYQASDFYKKTKIKLRDIIFEARKFYNAEMDSMINKLQEMIDGIDVERLTGVLEQTDDIFSRENEEATQELKTLKEILGK